MKEFLFSRSHKKHYSSAVVRMGKNNLGFSLVELIIVIAIMAVLAAVAIPVIGVFVERSKVASDIQLTSDIIYTINLAGQSMQYIENIDNAQASEEGLQVPVGFIILSTGKGADDGATVDKIKIIGSDANGKNAAAIDTIFVDLLDSNYASNMKLESDRWGNDTSIPDLYAGSEGLFTQVKSLSDVLASMSGLLSSVGFISQSYDSGIEAATRAAELVVGVGQDTFINNWATSHTSEVGFGVSEREGYMAVRYAYNEAVATYVANHSSATHTLMSSYTGNSSYSTDAATHTQQLSDFTMPVDMVITIDDVVPGTIRPNVFTGGTSADKLADKSHSHGLGCGFGVVCNASKDGGLGDDAQVCQTCCDLVRQYESSPEARADALAFYQVMATLSSTQDAAEQWATENPSQADDGWGFYSDYVQKFSALYEDLEAQTSAMESCIVITVFKNSEGILYAECNTPGVLDE